MTLGELFIKIGFKPDADQLKNAQSIVQKSADGIQARANLFKNAGTTVSNSFKSIGNGITGFFKGVNANANKLGDFIANIKAIHLQIIAVASAMVLITKKASDYAAELLRVNSVTGISTQGLQALQQQAAASGVEADEVNSTLKNLQRQAVEISMGRGNISAWAMLGVRPDEDPIKVLNALQSKLKGMSPARGSMFASELGLSDKMISFLKEAQSLGSSDKSLLLSDKEIKKLKEFNIFFNKAWDSSKRMLQRLGVVLMPIATTIINVFERLVRAAKDIGHFFEWFADNFKMITKVLVIFAGIIGVALFPLTAIFVGLALAIEDVVSWMRGDKSFTGAIIGPFKEWKETIDHIIDSLKTLQKTLIDLFTLQAWKDFGASFKQDLDRKPLGQSNLDKWKDADKNAVGPGQLFEQFKNYIGLGQKPDVTINVNGAGDPNEVAKKVVDHVNSNTMYQQPVQVK